MADVFISYSRADRSRVRPLADRLAASGYSVWWDVDLKAGDNFALEIETQVDAAKAVLTAWSSAARDSTWVYAEAARGLDNRKLVQARIDDVHLPLPFDALQVADLTGPRQSIDENWRIIENAVRRIVREGGKTEPPSRGLGAFATPEAAGAPKLISLITAGGLFVMALSLHKAHAGGLALDHLQYVLAGVLALSAASALLTAQRIFAIARAGG